MKYLIDTCALMRKRYLTYLEKVVFPQWNESQKLIVPQKVSQELHGIKGRKAILVSRAEEFLQKHNAKIFHNNSIIPAINADAEIITFCQQYRSKDDVTVFTHDDNLSYDLLCTQSTSNTSIVILRPDNTGKKAGSYSSLTKQLHAKLNKIAIEYDICLDSYALSSPFFRDCFLWLKMADKIAQNKSKLFIFEGSLSLIREKEDDYSKAAYQLAQEFISTGLLEILPGDFRSEEDYLNGILPFHHIGTKKLLLLTSRLQSSHYTTMHPKSVKGAPSYDLAILHHGGGIQMMREGATLPAPPKQQKQDSTKATVAPDKGEDTPEKCPSSKENNDIAEAKAILKKNGGNIGELVIQGLKTDDLNYLNTLLQLAETNNYHAGAKTYNAVANKIVQLKDNNKVISYCKIIKRIIPLIKNMQGTGKCKQKIKKLSESPSYPEEIKGRLKEILEMSPHQ